MLMARISQADGQPDIFLFGPGARPGSLFKFFSPARTQT